MSGLTADLIRAWERRYGILHPERTPGGYRVYSERDIAVLRRLKGLLGEGMAIGEAVRMVPRLLGEVEAPVADTDAAALPRVQAWQEALLEAADRLDAVAAADLLDVVLSTLQPLAAADQVIAPVLVEVGERWAAGTLTVAQEHLITHVLRSRLLTLLHMAPYGRERALLACMPDEQHEVGLLVVALHLRHSGYQTTVLGQRTPVASILESAKSLNASMVGLSLVMDLDPGRLKETLSALREGLAPSTALWIGGRAAVTHAEAIEAAGAKLFGLDEDWSVLEQPA